eukprot:CAMPEP_0172458750 /NCGR_PEP_ID=MMETSP1065-20121228/29061_1 /TAXON_ID=265537 /ORGANISM="Amphiprora paludosa, Strain CCMP125" /LENGTH=1408 /DNA_ID=CAMNT_0013213149 /DNA_START=128 /DNA_END=4351 /DNA_ORIENTATION=-
MTKHLAEGDNDETAAMSSMVEPPFDSAGPEPAALIGDDNEDESRDQESEASRDENPLDDESTADIDQYENSTGEAGSPSIEDEQLVGAGNDTDEVERQTESSSVSDDEVTTTELGVINDEPESSSFEITKEPEHSAQMEPSEEEQAEEPVADEMEPTREVARQEEETAIGGVEDAVDNQSLDQEATQTEFTGSDGLIEQASENSSEEIEAANTSAEGGDSSSDKTELEADSPDASLETSQNDADKIASPTLATSGDSIDQVESLDSSDVGVDTTENNLHNSETLFAPADDEHTVDDRSESGKEGAEDAAPPEGEEQEISHDRTEEASEHAEGEVEALALSVADDALDEAENEQKRSDEEAGPSADAASEGSPTGEPATTLNLAETDAQSPTLNSKFEETSNGKLDTFFADKSAEFAIDSGDDGVVSFADQFEPFELQQTENESKAVPAMFEENFGGATGGEPSAKEEGLADRSEENIESIELPEPLGTKADEEDTDRVLEIKESAKGEHTDGFLGYVSKMEEDFEGDNVTSESLGEQNDGEENVSVARHIKVAENNQEESVLETDLGEEQSAPAEENGDESDDIAVEVQQDPDEDPDMANFEKITETDRDAIKTEGASEHASMSIRNGFEAAAFEEESVPAGSAEVTKEESGGTKERLPETANFEDPPSKISDPNTPAEKGKLESFLGEKSADFAVEANDDGLVSYADQFEPFESQAPDSSTESGRPVFENNFAKDPTSDDDSNDICCNVCGMESVHVAEGMKLCQLCKSAQYCSKECLKWDWQSGGHADACIGDGSIIENDPPRCYVCGDDAPDGEDLKACENCNKALYCSEECLQWHWKSGGHASSCQSDITKEENDQGDELDTICDVCGMESKFVPDGMRVCVRCKEATYCSVECLQWDWNSGGHSDRCIDIRGNDENPDLPEVMETAETMAAILAAREKIRKENELSTPLPHVKTPPRPHKEPVKITEAPIVLKVVAAIEPVPATPKDNELDFLVQLQAENKGVVEHQEPEVEVVSESALDQPPETDKHGSGSKPSVSNEMKEAVKYMSMIEFKTEVIEVEEEVFEEEIIEEEIIEEEIIEEDEPGSIDFASSGVSKEVLFSPGSTRVGGMMLPKVNYLSPSFEQVDEEDTGVSESAHEVIIREVEPILEASDESDDSVSTAKEDNNSESIANGGEDKTDCTLDKAAPDNAADSGVVEVVVPYEHGEVNVQESNEEGELIVNELKVSVDQTNSNNRDEQISDTSADANFDPWNESADEDSSPNATNQKDVKEVRTETTKENLVAGEAGTEKTLGEVGSTPEVSDEKAAASKIWVDFFYDDSDDSSTSDMSSFEEPEEFDAAAYLLSLNEIDIPEGSMQTLEIGTHDLKDRKTHDSIEANEAPSNDIREKSHRSWGLVRGLLSNW